MATCSESGSDPSSRVLYLRLHLLPLEPLVGAILVVQLYPAREKQLHLHHGASSTLTQERAVENQKRMRTQLRRRMRTVHTTARPTLFYI